MSENEIQSPAAAGYNRRSVVKGAAWSVPVIAAAIAAPAASASNHPAWDLIPAFSGSEIVRLRVGVGSLGVNVVASLANRLIISNIGSEPSVAGTQVFVSYPGTLGSGVTLVSTDRTASVETAPGGFIITLPAIPAGGSITFNLGLVSLPVGILSGPQTITATVNADDANPGNNTATTDIGITVG